MKIQIKLTIRKRKRIRKEIIKRNKIIEMNWLGLINKQVMKLIIKTNMYHLMINNVMKKRVNLIWVKKKIKKK